MQPKISYSRYPPRKPQPPAKKSRARARNKNPNLKSGPSHPYGRVWYCWISPSAVGIRQACDSHFRRPSSPPPRRPPLLSLLRSEGQDAAALVGTAGPALPLAARAGRASWLAKCHRCRPWPSGRAAAAVVAWVGRPCSPRAGLGLDPVPICVVSVRSAPCCASSPLNGEIRHRFLLMNVYGSSVRCTVNCGSRVRVGQQSLSCLLYFSFL